jgi:hypothetical protein
MRVVVDRIKGKYAVCEKEDRTMINIEKERLPRGVKDGDVLLVEGDTITIDRSSTDRRKQDVKKLMDDLWKQQKRRGTSSHRSTGDRGCQ